MPNRTPRTMMVCCLATLITIASTASMAQQFDWPSISRNFTQTPANAPQKAIIIVGEAGSPVVAAADGEVKYAGGGVRDHGNLVILMHSNDLMTSYSNNQELLVQTGQMVRRGQQIATMGRTDAKQVQLTFQVRVRGVAVDPLDFARPGERVAAITAPPPRVGNTSPPSPRSPGKNANTPEPSVKNSGTCPSSYTFFDEDLIDPREHKNGTVKFLQLAERRDTKAELEDRYQLLRRCLDPATGPYFSYVGTVLGEDSYTQHYGGSLICRTPEYTRHNRDVTRSSAWKITVARLKAYECHRSQGWPSATDFSGPPSRKGQVAATSTQSPSTLDSRRANSTSVDNQAKSHQPPLTDSKKGGGSGKQTERVSPKYAPIIAGECVQIRQEGTGVSDMTKSISNNCHIPVQVLACFYDGKRYMNCDDPNQRWGTSSVISVGARTIMSAAVERPWRVQFFVCDASDRSLLCIHPKNWKE